MKAQNAGEALGLVMVDELVRCGMKDACLAPGSRSTPMALALAKNASLNLHVCIDERSAGFLALGIAKSSRRPVALLTTSGTATANLLPAVVEAHLSAVPLLLLTADRPPELRDTGAGQAIDQIKLYGDYVRWFAEVGVPEPREGSVQFWRSMACRAWAHCIHRPAGPVHLNLAFRDPLVPVADEAGFPFSTEGRSDGRPWHRFPLPLNEPSPGLISEVAGEISTAKRGLVVAGFSEWCPVAAPSVQGSANGRDPAAAGRLASHLGWPLLAEATSGARLGFPAISTYDALLRHVPFAQAHRPDLIIRIGSIGLSRALNQILDHSVKQITVYNGPFVPDPRRSSSTIICADPASTCDELVRQAESNPAGGWLEGWIEAEGLARSEIDRLLDLQPTINEPVLARDLAGWLPEGGNLVAASSMPIRDLDWYMRPRDNLKLFANRGANGIDGFVSTVLGIALAADGYTAALCGDLSLLHDQNGFLLAANNPVHAAFVVANNNGGGIFSFLPQAADEAHFERLFGTPHNLDLKALSGVYGLRHTLVETPSDLAPALENARSKGGLHILEAKTDRAANVEIHRALWKAVADALG